MRYLLILGLAAACDGGTNVRPDAAIDGRTVDTPPMPTGPHHGFVASGALMPSSSTQARMMGMDLNGDQTVDNQMGMVLGVFAAQGIEVQAGADQAIDRGGQILLVDVQTTSFDAATNAGVTVYEGANPVPAACASLGDTVCRHHLQGDATIEISSNAIPTTPLIGTFASGTLETSLGGRLHTPIPFLGVSFELLGARMRVSGTDHGLMQSIIAGGIRESDFPTKVYPRLQGQLMAMVTRDCTELNNPGGGCGCGDGTSGKNILGLFDTSPKDCMVSIMEIENNSLIQSLFAPDLVIEGQECISVGFQFEAVAASITP